MAERGGGATGTVARGVAPPSGLLVGASLEVAFGNGTATGDPSGARVPSKLTAGERPNAMATRPMPRTISDVRIARLLRRPARMGHRAVARRPNLLGVLPEISRGELGLARLP